MASFQQITATKSEKAKPSWGKDRANEIFNDAVNSNYSFYSKRQQIKDNQLWAEGGQSIDEFKDELETGGDVSWLNFNLDIANPLPKLGNLFVGSSTNRTSRVVVEATDNQSRSEKDEEYKRLLRKMKLKPLEGMLKELGIPVDLEDAPEDKSDIEDEMELNYKVPVESALELCVRDVFKASGEDEIKRKIALDIFENNTGVTKVCYKNGQRYFKHVKLGNFVTSYCDYDDFRDAYYMGEVVILSVADAISQYPDKLSKEEWAKVAANFGGRFGNVQFGIDDYYNGTISWEQINSLKIQVFDFQLKSTNKYRWKDKKTRKGTRIIEGVDDSYDPTGKHNVEMIERELVDIYEGVWIIDTAHMLKWRLKPNMIRKISDGEIMADTEFDYTVYKPNQRNGVNKSLTELIKPHAKNIMIYTLKIMHFVMKARPAGAFIDATSLSAIAAGMGDPQLATADPMEIYDAFDQTGVLVFSSVRQDGSEIHNTTPVMPYDGGVSSGIERLVFLRNAEMQEIYNISGFNPAVDGSQMPKDTLVGIEKLRANSFNITMKPYVDVMTKVLEETAKKVAEQEKDYIVFNKEYAKKVAAKIGKENVDYIKLINSARLCELGIHIEYEPEEEDMQVFNLELERSIQNGQITAADSINCREIAKTSIKQATIYLKKAIKKKASDDAKLAQQASQANQKAQMNSNLQAEQIKMESLKLDYQLKTQYMVLEKKLEAAMQKDKAIQERVTKVLEGQISEALIEESGNINPSDNKVSNKVGGGETKTEGVVRKRGTKGLDKATRQKNIPSQAGGSPRVVPRPSDNSEVNAKAI